MVNKKKKIVFDLIIVNTCGCCLLQNGIQKACNKIHVIPDKFPVFWLRRGRSGVCSKHFEEKFFESWQMSLRLPWEL